MHHYLLLHDICLIILCLCNHPVANRYNLTNIFKTYSKRGPLSSICGQIISLKLIVLLIDADIIDEQPAQKVRLLCWIMTNPKNHDKKAKHVKATWGRRCDILLFISSAYDPQLPTVKIDIPVEGHGKYLWTKAMGAFNHCYHHYLDKADWFLRADDDTYVVVENLRYFLSKHNTTLPIHFGRRLRSPNNIPYMHGGIPVKNFDINFTFDSKLNFISIFV
jgi:hypothetical protein